MYGLARPGGGFGTDLSNAITVNPVTVTSRQELNNYRQQQSGRGAYVNAGYRTNDLKPNGSGKLGPTYYGQPTGQPSYQQPAQTSQPAGGSGLRSMGRTVMTYAPTQQPQSQGPSGGYYAWPEHPQYGVTQKPAGGMPYYQHPGYPTTYPASGSPDPSYGSMTSPSASLPFNGTPAPVTDVRNRVQINTSIQPQPVYSDDYTRRASNLAGASMVPSLSMALGANAQEGVSIASPMVGYNAGRDYANQMGQARLAPYQVSQQHAFANAENILSGQGARDSEALAWANLAAQQYGSDLNYQNAMQNNMLRLLQSGSQWWR